VVDHKMQDDVDTAKVVLRENTRVEFQSTLVPPGQRAQVVIVPESTMESPVLFMSQDPNTADVSVEQIVVGHFVVLVSPGKVADFKFGRPLLETVTPEEPLRVVFRHSHPATVKVGASLVVSEKPGTYRIVDREKLSKG
jgi:hypothetical protein